MAVNEHILVTRWVEHRDAEAFKTLALAHAPMVARTCRRILRNPHDAEEVAQECFEDSARTANPPTRCVGGWLHRVATFKSVNRAKAERRRREREDRFSRENGQAEEAPWEEVYDQVDESLAALPEKYRMLLVLHFFENETHAAIAERLGVSRGTVTYRIKKGVETLRKNLKRRGIAVSVGALAAGLTNEGAQAAEIPVKLAESIARIALAGRPAVPVPTPGPFAEQVTTTLGGRVMSAKWFLLTAGIAVIAVTGVVVKHMEDGDGAAPMAAPVVIAQAPTDVAPPQSEAGEEPSPPAADSVEEPSAVEGETAKVEAPPSTGPRLDGLWEAQVEVDGRQETEQESGLLVPVRETMRIVVEQSGLQVTVREPEGAFTLVGTLAGNSLRLIDVEEPPGAEFEGTFAQDWQTGTFEGSMVSLDGTVEKVSARIERLAEEEQLADATTEARRDEIEALGAPLLAYYNAHGAFPKDLEALVPNYAENLDALSSTKERSVTYHPARNIEDLPVATEIPPLDDGSGVPFPDRLMAYEEQLRNAWGGALPGLGAFLRVTYADPEQRFVFESDGVREEAPPTVFSEGVALCQNNLKQLILVSRIFENENGGYAAPGWYTVYPEYLADPQILTCQAHPVGTDSYEILFPATHVDFLVGLYESVTGETAARNVCLSRIPMVVERDNHGGGADEGATLFRPAGRNVAFADGHVEFVSTQVWEANVAPYLEYR